MEAHKRDITLNQMVEEVLRVMINKHTADDQTYWDYSVNDFSQDMEHDA
jgi:hypothetical protein